jgi:hypothetical protein
MELYRSVLVYELRLAQRARYALNNLAVLPELCPEILVLPTLADIFSASNVQSSVSDPGSDAYLDREKVSSGFPDLKPILLWLKVQ